MRRLSYLCVPFVFLSVAFGQAKPTATRSLQPSAFVMFGGTVTGIGALSQQKFVGSKTLDLSAGLDVGFYSFGRYVVAAEGRGDYPVFGGKISKDQYFAGGARLSRESGADHAFRPYVDALFGRGQTNYPDKGGYIHQNFLYQQTASAIYGGGAGVELDMTDSFSLKLDAQALHWNTPVLDSGSAWSKQVAVGVTYRIGTGRYPPR